MVSYFEAALKKKKTLKTISCESANHSEKIWTHCVLCAPPQMVQFSASIHLKNRSSSHKILLRSDQLPMLECLTWMIDSMQTPYRVQVFKKSLVQLVKKDDPPPIFSLSFILRCNSQNKLSDILYFIFFTKQGFDRSKNESM